MEVRRFICSQFEKRIFAIYGNSEKVNAMSMKHMGIWVGLISSITLLVASVANADTEDATGSGTTVFFGEDAPERYGLQDLTHSYNFLNRDDWVDNPNLNRLGLDGLPAVGALMEEMPGHHEVYGLVQVATSWEGVNRDSGGSDTTRRVEFMTRAPRLRLICRRVAFYWL